MTAIEWQSTVDEADRAVSMQRLWSGLEDQHKLDTALMTASRKDGQRLSVMQIKYDFDPTHRQVPSGTMHVPRHQSKRWLRPSSRTAFKDTEACAATCSARVRVFRRVSSMYAGCLWRRRGRGRRPAQ
jgi:hypothetical protein